MQRHNMGKVSYSEGYAMQSCNSTSNNVLDGATSNATTSIKALAKDVLLRNRQSNSDATATIKSCNSSSNSLESELEKLLENDLAYYVAHPDALGLAKELFRDRQKMRVGIIPDSYCCQAYCDSCGDIPLYTIGHFAGCPWCLLGGFKNIVSSRG